MKRVVFFCLFALGAGLAHSQPADRAVLLVASPDLEGAYRHTALIAFPSGRHHVGFIVNRATDKKLAALFPDHAPSAKVADPVHLGGPEMSEALFAVVRRDPGEGALPLPGGLYLVASADAVDRVIEKTPGDARFFAGFVGWQPGELQKEIDAGYWYVTDADPGLFFRQDTSKLWDELVERLGNGHRPQRGFLSASLQPTSPPGVTYR